MIGSIGASGGIIGLGVFGWILRLRQPHLVSTRHGVMVLLFLGLKLYEDFTGFLTHGFLPRIHMGGYLAGLVLGLVLIGNREPIRYAPWVDRIGNWCGVLVVGAALIVAGAIASRLVT